MKSVPPDEFDRASGGANGEEGWAWPNPEDCAPKPVEGNPLGAAAGEAGWEPNENPLFVTAGNEGLLKPNGEGWLKVDGLPGADPTPAEPKGLDAALLPKEKGAAVVGVAAPLNEKPPPVLGRGASLPVDLEGPKVNGAAVVGVGVGVAEKAKGFGSSGLAGEEKGLAAAAPNANVDVGGTDVLIGGGALKSVEGADEFPNPPKLSMGLLAG